MPENSSSLSVESVVFPQNNFTYFNVTVLNPSNSVSDLNITGFQVLVESQNETFSVGTVEPALPFLLGRGTKQGFKCLENWSGFAGETVRVEPSFAANASVQSSPYVTPMVNLVVSDFSTAEDAQHFNLTVQNSQESAINLTVTEIRVFDIPVNSTPSLPTALLVGQQQVFRCAWNWADLGGQNLTLTVFTDVGFEQVYQTNPVQSASLIISDVQFDNASTGYFNITVKSLPPSAVLATLSGVNLTSADNTTLALGTSPPLTTSIVSVVPNGTQSITCLWDWSGHRNESIVVQVFTKQGFTLQNITVTTPPAVIWSVNNVHFDLDDLAHFSINVTNAPASLYEVNVTEVDFNQTTTSVNPTVVAPGNLSVVVCGFNWTGFVGTNVTVTVHVAYGQNETTTSLNLTVPYVKVVNASFSDFLIGNPYINLTVFDSQYSPFNANITQISVTANNVTSLIDGTLTVPRIGSNGYLLSIGTEATFVCPWDWHSYSGQNVMFTVQTADGSTFSATFQAG
jgi:hypothetical protein